jgi:predicted dehydrogenase
VGYRAALVGCGKIGSEFAEDPLMSGDVFTHAEAYVQCSDTELVAVCDTNPHRLRQCGERWNVSHRYQSLSEMLKSEQLDIVSVCTPDATHYEILRALLTSRLTIKAILCEKPFVTSVAEAEEVLRLAAQRDVELVVVFLRRYAENMRKLKAFLDQRKLGTIQAINGWYTKGTLHNGSHWLDLLRFLFGEIEWVEATNALSEDGPDPTLDLLLGLTRGGMASLRACRAEHFTIFEMDIMMTQGRIQLLDSGYNIVLSRVQPSTRYSGYSELHHIPATFGDRRSVMLHAVEDLITSLESGEPPASNARSALRTLRVSLAAQQAAQTGKRVLLDFEH